MTSMEDLARRSQEDRSALEKSAGKDGSLSILFSDIEDSTDINEQPATRNGCGCSVLTTGSSRRASRSTGATSVKSQGDGFMIAFREAADAVRAGLEIQDALSATS